jgi:hypothetical protein
MPAIPAPEPGLVIRYDYVWTSDAAAGRDFGKERPACIVVVIDKPGVPSYAGILPITHTPPAAETEGIEIPATTSRRLGLDEAPCWVKFSEYNVELWPPPGLYLVPGRHSFTYGFLPPKLFNQIKSSFTIALTHGLARQAHRHFAPP